MIHLDDTVETIKKKIILEHLKQFPDDPKIVYEEIYLFGHVEKKLNLMKLYNELTDNEKRPFLIPPFQQAYLNITDTPFLGEMPISNFEEFQSKFQTNEFFTRQPIGIEFKNAKNELGYPISFPVNPNDMIVLPKESETTYHEQKLLFEYVDQLGDIDVCLFSKDNTFITTQLYYPNLFELKITSYSALEEKRDDLIRKTDKFANELPIYKNIDLFYEPNETKEMTEGMREFTLYMLPDTTKEFPPLEIVFKNIHATATVPLIYYPTNSGNTFRLYCDTISKNGKKIPLLDKNTISRLWRKIDKNPKISGINKEYIRKKDKITLYIQSEFAGRPISLFMDFKSNGVITVYCDALDYSITLANLTEIMKTTVNDIIRNVNQSLEITGFVIQTYDDIENNAHIRLENIRYFVSSTMEDDMNIMKCLECSNLLFIPVIPISDTYAELNYIRISQYKRMDTKLIYVYKQLEALAGEDANFRKTILDGLAHHFPHLKKEEREDLFKQGLEEFDKNADIVLPGFFTTFRITERRELLIEVQSISNIYYLKLIQNYMVGLLDICRMPDKMKLLCHEKALVEKHYNEMEEFELEDIIEDEEDVLEDEEDVLEDEEDVLEEDVIKGKIGYDDNDDSNDGNDDDEIIGKIGYDDAINDKYEDKEIIKSIQKRVKKGNAQEYKKISTKLLERLKTTAPDIFADKNNEPTYSNKCQGDKKPVILNQRELDNINKHDDKFEPSYQNPLMVKYDDKTNFYFICPRYWSIEKNRSISEKELEEGIKSKKYKLLNRHDEKRGRNLDGNVYQFTPTQEEGFDPRIKPTFVPAYKIYKNAKGIPLPCCYHEAMKDVASVKKLADPNRLSEYITEKFPLEKNRFGYLFPALDAFFGNNRTGFIDAKTRKVVPNVKLLLRQGVQDLTAKQSFLSCFADIYNYTRDKENDVDLKEFVSKLLRSIDLDFFVSAHRSYLPAIFKPLVVDYASLSNKIDTYQNTEFYKTIDFTDDYQEEFFLETVAAFLNFQSYIKDNAIPKDHVYLWDIMTHNSKLFGKKINLIIFEMVEDDRNEKLNIVCPSHSYASHFYDENLSSVFLVKKNDIYEPIYIYYEEVSADKQKRTTYLAKTYEKKHLVELGLKRLTTIIKTIETNIHDKCISVKNITSPITQSISLDALYDIIKEVGKYRVEAQVLNYSHKVIGLLLEKSEGKVVVPCRPSPLLSTTVVENVVYMDNADLWQSYDETVQQLEDVFEAHHRKIPCKPAFVAVETAKKMANKKNNVADILLSRIVVGIITQTNQFVEVTTAEYNAEEHGLPIIEQSNTNKLDKILARSSTGQDKERVQVVKTILFEGQFYSAFRTTIRALINDYANREVRQSILTLIDKDSSSTYDHQIENIRVILKSVSTDEIMFAKVDLDTIDEIGTCIHKTAQTCQDSKQCIIRMGKCGLVIPKNNLITGEDNESSYYLRLSDELVRYKRIQLYFFQNTINMIDIEYKINRDELVIIQNLLIADDKNNTTYFDNLETFQRNKYIHRITYDDAEPYIDQKLPKQVLDNIVETEELGQEMVEDNACIVKIGNMQGTDAHPFKKLFPGAQEIVYESTVECTFQALQKILSDRDFVDNSIEFIKGKLVEAYRAQSQYLPALLKLWRDDKKITKKDMGMTIGQVVDFIQGDAYYMTDIDIWLLADKMELPIFLFCITGLKIMKPFSGETAKDKIWWITLGPLDIAKKYHFLRSPTESKLEQTIRPGYQLLASMYFIPNELKVNRAKHGETQSLVEFLRKL